MQPACLKQGARKKLASFLPLSVQASLRSLLQTISAAKSDFFDQWKLTGFLIRRRLQNGKPILLLRRMDALGDVICTLPLAIELRKRHPECHLIFLTSKYCGQIVHLARCSDGIFCARFSIFKPSRLNLFLVRYYYNAQTTDERTQTGPTRHLIDDLAESCGITLVERQPRLTISRELITTTQAAFKLDREIQAGRRLIAINCGPTWPVRLWQVKKWQQLIDRIHAEYSVCIIQFGVHVSSQLNEYDELKNTVSVISRTTTEQMVALIAGCSLLISIDSGPIHVAGAVGTPVVGLFGAVNPAFRLPPNSLARGLFAAVPCLFCHHQTPIGHWKANCPNHIICMEKLDVDTVFAEVQTMLDNRA